MSDIESIEFGHTFGIILIPQVLLCATAAVHGLSSLIERLLEHVLSDGGAAMFGSFADANEPIQNFLRTEASKYMSSSQLKRIISANKDVSIESVLHREIVFRGRGADAMEQELLVLATLGRAVKERANLDYLVNDSVPCHVLESSLKNTTAAARQLPDGVLELSATVDYYIVTKKERENGKQRENNPHVLPSETTCLEERNAGLSEIQ